MTPGSDLKIGDEFSADGQTWIVRGGWCSAVGHIVAEAKSGERRVFLRHCEYRVTPVPQNQKPKREVTP